jgi:hypothetical protein
MSEDSLTLAEVQQACGVQEEMGFDAPFATFTWERWLEMEARVVQGLTRFQRAIEQRDVQVALFVALELQEVMSEMQKEAYTWIGVGKKQD